ncbi:hypothetical protein EWM64_g803 [Hericium alpestre]|uniref:Prolyl 4-hydroxylase alpha subunit Fe(2+) 2OG dioxygenase domain-containing protein n=1 Tax=Hericium alpestre TaxID=135208 RepID=A0A4Z0AA75_9AGAM|nr:hypothetical protein EWM64_g803 [Hericium alpestre]
MFGSLVLVFSTQHEGGALVLRHHGKEWMFDSAQAVKKASSTIGFIAFFSDVEHEVSRVTAGYRFTLTYNLYYDDLSPTTSDSLGASSNAATLASFKAAFSDLLLNREFLPSGGLVGIALEHAYPVDESNNLKHIPSILKGSDAMVWRACDDLDLEPEIFVVYGEPGEHNWRFLMDRVDGWDTSYVGGGFIELLTEWEGAILIEELERVHGVGWDDTKDVTPVSWVVAPEATRTRVKTHYTAYGNEASVGCTYGEGCMIVDVPALEVREARAEMASSTD